MPDRIVLRAMEFEGHHGVTEDERSLPQVITVDLEAMVDLRTAGVSDDLDQTVDYSTLFDVCRRVVQDRSFHLLEGIAEAIATEVLAGFAAVESVRVRVRKPGVPIDGVLEYAGVEVDRVR